MEELDRLGYQTIPEPGRRIIAEEMERRGSALPWIDMAAFARRAIALALEDLHRAETMTGTVFFDRGLVDATGALLHVSDIDPEKIQAIELCSRHRYQTKVFMTPPWPEIYKNDSARQHGFQSAVEEYDRLCELYPRLGYQTIILPRNSIPLRARFMIAHLSE